MARAVAIGRPPRQGEPDLFAALAEPTRRHLLERLVEGELTVTQLGEGLPVSQAAVSQHLRVLKIVGLVQVRPAGRLRYHRLRMDGLDELREWLDRLDRFWNDRPGALGSYLDRQ